MKKIYIQPKQRLIYIDTQDLMDGSFNTNDEEVKVDGEDIESLSRGGGIVFDVWDEDDTEW